MNNWIPVIGTLLGAIVAGSISVILSFLSNRHATQNTKLVLAEERARWAIEKRLQRLQTFHGIIEKLANATSQFRIQQAWQASYEKEPGLKPPKFVGSYEKARGEWEKQLGEVHRELLMQDEEVQSQFKQSNITWLRWLASKSIDEGVETLFSMEDDIQAFTMWLAKRYRSQFEGRYRGADHAT
jgi:type II secretory pathway component PulJ